MQPLLSALVCTMHALADELHVLCCYSYRNQLACSCCFCLRDCEILK